MNQNELDTLLREQEKIEDINFTSKVMENIRKSSFSKKSRFYLPFGMMGLGTVISFIILPSEKLLQFFEEGINGAIFSKLTILGLFSCLALFFVGFLSMIDEEMR